MGNLALIEQRVVLHLVKVEGRAVQYLIFPCEVMDECGIHECKRTHLFVEGHVGDSGKTEVVLAIGAHLNKSQLKEAVRHIVEGILEHGEVGASFIADGRSKRQHGCAAIA